MCRSASGESYLLTANAMHECRDSACRRPFGVRLRGNGWFQHSPLRHCAAPLRMTRRVWRFVRYSLFVIMLLYGTILYYPRNKHPACHSERSGTDIGNQAIKSRTAAESNPEGAPAGGISALAYGILHSNLQWSSAIVLAPTKFKRETGKARLPFESVLLQRAIQPDHANAECVVKTFLIRLADDLVRIFGIHQLNQYALRHF